MLPRALATPLPRSPPHSLPLPSRSLPLSLLPSSRPWTAFVLTSSHCCCCAAPGGSIPRCQYRAFRRERVELYGQRMRRLTEESCCMPPSTIVMPVHVSARVADGHTYDKAHLSAR
eukprot:2589310-Rhodomonas_salina.6